MLKIWGRANSINVQKVLWCCGELGLQYDRIDAGNEFGVTKTPEYRVLNPNGLVPTIEDGDFQLWESNVIVRYLAQKSEHSRLCPVDIRTRFDAERWMDWQATVFWWNVPDRKGLPGEKRTIGKTGIEHLCGSERQGFGPRDDRRIAICERRPDQFNEQWAQGRSTTVHRWYALDIHHPELPNPQRWYDLMKQRRPFQEVVITP